jgi:transcriptional regulator with PAS, ATPase and Fis domain
MHKSCDDPFSNISVVSIDSLIWQPTNSDKYFHETIDCFPTIICEIDCAYRLLYVNRIGLQRAGITNCDIEKGICALDFLCPNDHCRAKLYIINVLSGDFGNPKTYQIITKSGLILHGIISSVPIIENGVKCGIRCFIWDVSNENRLRKQLTELQSSNRVPLNMRQVQDDTQVTENEKRKIPFIVDQNLESELTEITGQDHLNNRDLPASIYETFITANEDLKSTLYSLQAIARTKATVLIQGETGTGKELVARAIHDLGPRKEKPFIALNCAALPETLVEAELFGYKAGAFTDAKKDNPGKFVLVQGGTIFLDEIGDLSLNVQAKLLRVIQEKSFYPLGCSKPSNVDVRIITATHRNLEELVHRTKFRQDLFYRIKVVTVQLPPLRERKEDIPVLCKHFIAKSNQCHQKKIKMLSLEAMERLLQHDFPGNVRELENAIEHAYTFCENEIILVNHLPAVFQEKKFSPIKKNPPKTLEDLKCQHIIDAIIISKGNKTEAAKRLGIHKATLFRKLKFLNIDKK